jgi:hypothetical protein
MGHHFAGLHCTPFVCECTAQLGALRSRFAPLPLRRASHLKVQRMGKKESPVEI